VWIGGSGEGAKVKEDSGTPSRQKKGGREGARYKGSHKVAAEKRRWQNFILPAQSRGIKNEVYGGLEQWLTSWMTTSEGHGKGNPSFASAQGENTAILLSTKRTVAHRPSRKSTLPSMKVSKVGGFCVQFLFWCFCSKGGNFLASSPGPPSYPEQKKQTHPPL